MKKLHLPLAGSIFLIAAAVYNEVLFHLWTGGSFAAAQLIPLLLFAAGLGCVPALIAGWLPPKAAKIFSAAMALLMAAACMTEYCLNECFSSFMPPAMIFKEAGGVATGFMDVVLTLLKANFFRILLILLPIGLFIGFVEPERAGLRLKFLPALAGIAFCAAGCAAMTALCGNMHSLTDEFSFDASVRRNGLAISTLLEVAGDRAAGEAMVFEPAELPTQPTVQPSPAQDSAGQTQPEEESIPLRYHVIDLDFSSLAQGNSTIAQLCRYVASQTPSTDNEYTGLFKDKNLIFITAEAFTAQVIDPELTPTLYRMATQGIYMPNYYQPGWNGGTTGGELSNLSSLVPKPSLGMGTFSTHSPFITIGNRLKDLGYFSRAYHNNTGTFYDRNRTHPGLGYEKFIAMYSGMEKGVENQFPQSDLEMIDFTVPQYIDNQPFSIYYMTVSGHSVYTLSQHTQAQKHYSKLEGTHWSEPVRVYLAAQLELEYAMESLLRQLEEAGIADDTVVVISPDHYPYGLDSGTAWGNGQSYLPELYGVSSDEMNNFVRDHTAGIIWSGCLEGKNITVEEPVYSLDLLPTLCNLFDVEYDSRLLVGRDIFSDTAPLVLWPDHSWITDMGRYDASEGTFTPAQGVDVPAGYADTVSAIVKNKINYSHSALANYFFAYLSKEMQKNG